MQGRFKAILLERDTFLLEMCRHVVLNPLRTKTVKSPEKYLWSSYRATAGLAEVPPFLSTDWLLRHFGKQKKTAERNYQEFILDGQGRDSPWNHLRKQILLGGEEFVAAMARLMNEAGTIREHQLRERRKRRPTLTQLFAKARDRVQRNDAIRLAHITHLYSLNEIGNFVGLHFATVSKIANAASDE